jgi:hypothetical protein
MAGGCSASQADEVQRAELTLGLRKDALYLDRGDGLSQEGDIPSGYSQRRLGVVNLETFLAPSEYAVKKNTAIHLTKRKFASSHGSERGPMRDAHLLAVDQSNWGLREKWAD